jgi:hypothetical protein
MSARTINQTTLALVLALGVALLAPLGAQAEYGISSFDVQIAAKAPEAGDEADLAPSGGAYHQAGGHPYSIVTHIEWNNHPDPSETVENHGNPLPDGDIRDTDVDLPAGLVGNPATLPTCTAAQLGGADPDIFGYISECPIDSQVGQVRVRFGGTSKYEVIAPLFNMAAPSGLAGRFGFNVVKTLVYFDASTGPERGYRITVGSHGASQALRVYGADVAFWGVPGDPAHDSERCNRGAKKLAQPVGSVSNGPCPGAPGAADGPHSAGQQPVPFLTLPTSCPADETQGEEWSLRTTSWEEPDVIRTASAFNHLPPFAPDVSAPGAGQGTTGCAKVPFNPDFGAQPTQKSAASSSGLEVSLRFPLDGLLNPKGIAQSHLRKAVVTLPEGMTVNPSQAEGLGVCTPAQYAAATVDDPGCPSTAKLGSVVVHTPLLHDTLEGNVYIAEPYQNPFKSLLALYIVIRNHDRGLLVKLPGKVEPDPRSGQITATFDDLPQVPFESFEFHFREGSRAPLITPRTCGTYVTKGEFTPWSDPSKVITGESSFEIDRGVDGAPCPAQGVPPFHPGFTAGTLNNNAGSFSPFLMRLLRGDGEQDMTKFSAILPPGVSAKIAGITWCPASAIELARQKSGTEEREAPSCPANSQIGNIIAAAGVGSTLVYVPGRLYLSGPFNGAPLSAVAVVPAVAGPFDVGTVVTRVALGHDPRTARVRVEGDRSDPIPHILAGIPLAVREIRVSTDRPNFTINPTSCDPSQVAAAIFGSNTDLFSSADDLPVALASRFQAANCAALGFRPALSMRLGGGTRRGQFPSFKATLTPRAGDANLSSAVVKLPRSTFLEQGHIRTICTRVQYAQKSCPRGSVYGHVKAFTPLLDEPLEGPVYLRSSDHKLPDMVLSMDGVVDIEAVGRVDSVKGRIRTSFELLPDAPVSKVLLTMQGGRKGLIVNSVDLCAKTPRASASFEGHNGKARDFKPALKSVCRKSKKHNAKRPNHKPQH